MTEPSARNCSRGVFVHLHGIMRASTFKAVGASWPVILTLSSRRHDEDGRPYLTTSGAGAYFADLVTGVCEGTEGTRGHTLRLVPGALRRLRKILRDRS